MRVRRSIRPDVDVNADSNVGSLQSKPPCEPTAHAQFEIVNTENLDASRVRSARHDLLPSALGDPNYHPRAAKRKKSKLAAEADKIRAKLALNPHLRSIPLVSQVLEGLKRSVQSSPEG